MLEQIKEMLADNLKDLKNGTGEHKYEVLIMTIENNPDGGNGATMAHVTEKGFYFMIENILQQNNMLSQMLIAAVDNHKIGKKFSMSIDISKSENKTQVKPKYKD